MRHSCDSVVSPTCFINSVISESIEAGRIDGTRSFVLISFYSRSTGKILFSLIRGRKKKKQDGNDTIIASKREGKPS